MLLLTNSGTSQTVKVLDHRPVMLAYQKLGLPCTEMEHWNSFVYGTFPEGSHGKFLIASKDVAALNTGKFEVTLSFTNLDSALIHTHQKLMVRCVQYFEVSLQAFAIGPPAGVEGESQHLAVVELVDYCKDLDSLVTKDYNRVTVLAPKDTDNPSEPLPSDLKSYDEIINDILADNPVGGVTLTLASEGFPSTGFKPKNVLLAGSTIRDSIKLIADIHFMVAFIDKDGVLTITNAQTSSELLPGKNQLIYSAYGPVACPTELTIVFSENAHQFSKQRSTLFIEYDDVFTSADYYPKFEEPWSTKVLEPASGADPTLANTTRTPSSGNSESIYYPFFQMKEYGVYDADGGTTALTDAIKANFEKRIQRELKLVFKDLVICKPSATVSKVSYFYTGNGIVTKIESSPPEKVSVPPITNHAARSLEYVPPFLQGIVSPGGADYDASIPGYPAPEDDTTDVEGEILLPAIDPESEDFPIKVWVKGHSPMIEEKRVGVHFNVHKRRYEYVEPEGGGGKGIEYVIQSIVIATGGPYTGLKVATVVVKGASDGALIETTVEVVDHTGCYFDDETDEDMVGYTGQAQWGVFLSLEPEVECDTLTPFHWYATNRCCAPNTGIYANPCTDGDEGEEGGGP